MSSDFFGRQSGRYRNQLTQSFAELVGIAEGIIADRVLVDDEIGFLNAWLDSHDAIANEWPGDVVYKRVRAALADGVITSSERAHLIETLQLLIAGRLDDLASAPKVNMLAMDDVTPDPVAGSNFCLTGEFALAPREQCEKMIIAKGGIVLKDVTRKLNYLIVGGLGSDEWKHGSFGLKIKKAIEYKEKGVPIKIIHEDRWATTI